MWSPGPGDGSDWPIAKRTKAVQTPPADRLLVSAAVAQQYTSMLPVGWSSQNCWRKAFDLRLFDVCDFVVSCQLLSLLARWDKYSLSTPCRLVTLPWIEMAAWPMFAILFQESTCVRTFCALLSRVGEWFGAEVPDHGGPGWKGDEGRGEKDCRHQCGGSCCRLWIAKWDVRFLPPTLGVSGSGLLLVQYYHLSDQLPVVIVCFVKLSLVRYSDSESFNWSSQPTNQPPFPGRPIRAYPSCAMQQAFRAERFTPQVLLHQAWELSHTQNRWVGSTSAENASVERQVPQWYAVFRFSWVWFCRLIPIPVPIWWLCVLDGVTGQCVSLHLGQWKLIWY